MRIHVQPNQLLGCFCSELLKSGRNVFHLDELIVMCGEIDKNLSRIDSTLEVSKEDLIDTINRYKKQFLNDGLIYLLYEKPHHYIDLFSTTLPSRHCDNICSTIRSELSQELFRRPFEHFNYSKYLKDNEKYWSDI